LAGCNTVHEARLAQDPSTAILGERPAKAAELGLATSGPIALDSLVPLALTVHPTLVRARYDAQAAGARVREAESAKYPLVSTDASVTWRDAQGAGATSHFESLGFSLSWL